MVKVNVKMLVPRLVPHFEEYMRLVRYIHSVQGTNAARLDYAAAAKVLGVDWKTVKRLCDKLAKIEVIYYEGNGLRLNEAAISV